MDKSIVLNICGVKSLGGLNVVNSAINMIDESEYQLIILHDNNLTEPLEAKSDIIKIETSLKRYFHPFLDIFLSRKDMSTINNANAILHFGNFGFKTKNKSYTLIQNLLPLEIKDLKNIILKYFINKSFKQSDYIIYQLDHVAEKINIQFESKLIKIGVIDKSEKDLNTEIGVIGIMSETRNKNSNFMEEVLNRVAVDSPEYKITKFISTDNQKHSEKNPVSLSEQYPRHNIYFHTSFYETVGLPLYEASSAGLFIVAPDCEYMKHFDNTNSIKYKHEDIESATRCIKDALNSNKKAFQSLHYKEDWNPVLESI